MSWLKIAALVLGILLANSMAVVIFLVLGTPNLEKRRGNEGGNKNVRGK